MLNSDFYPSTEAVIEAMLRPYYEEGRREYRRSLNLHSRTILEPSAGSGAILDYVSQALSSSGYYGRSEQRLYCCEKDPELKAILQSKNCRLLGDDFLSYQGDLIFDLVLMNPPFAKGDKHVLHAYRVVGHGGEVVALVNAETIRNPYSETRQQLARLIADFGSVEDLGRPFVDSDRPTDVEVCLIRLKKPAEGDPFAFSWQNLGREGVPELNEDTFKNQLATRDVIGNIMTQFAGLKEQFANLLKAIDGVKFYGRGLVRNGEYRDAWKIAEESIKDGAVGRDKGYAKSYNLFADAMRQEIWQTILAKVNIQKYLTYQVRQNFQRFSQQTGYLDVTHENVGQLVQMVLDSTGLIMEEAVVNCFDMFTEYYKENRHHVEGWKTNSRYKVNKKIILPYWVKLSEHCQDFSIDWSRQDSYSDIDKVMCWLTGENYDRILHITTALEYKFRQLGRVGSGTFPNTCQSTFFYLKFFKKGTVHLEFKDERLWQEFNLRACAGKQWLPEPEMQAYQRRKRGPFDPEPAARPGTPTGGVVRQLNAPSTQLNLLDMFGQAA